MVRKAMSKSTKTAILTIFLTVIGVFAIYGGYRLLGGQALAIGTVPENQVKVEGNADAFCALAPTLSLSEVNKFNKGTAVSTGVAYSVDGASYTFTAPSLAVGSKVKVMLNASNYITTVVDLGAVPCGAKPLSLEIPAYQAPTIKVYDDAYNLLSDSVTGAVNGSKTPSGGSTTLTVKFSGNNQKTSGNLIYVVETSTSANITESGIAMYDNGVALKRAKVPTFYTNTLTSPRVVAFEIPEIVGSADKVFTLSFTASNSKVVQGAVYTTAYVEQAFIDVDGQAGYGVENSDGTSKALANFDYDVVLK